MLGLIGCGSSAIKTSSFTISSYPSLSETENHIMSSVVEIRMSETISSQSCDQQSARMEQEGLAKASSICYDRFGNQFPRSIQIKETRENNIITVEIASKCR